MNSLIPHLPFRPVSRGGGGGGIDGSFCLGTGHDPSRRFGYLQRFRSRRGIGYDCQMMAVPTQLT